MCEHFFAHKKFVERYCEGLCHEGRSCLGIPRKFGFLCTHSLVSRIFIAFVSNFHSTPTQRCSSFAKDPLANSLVFWNKISNGLYYRHRQLILINFIFSLCLLVEFFLSSSSFVQVNSMYLTVRISYIAFSS